MGYVSLKDEFKIELQIKNQFVSRRINMESCQSNFLKRVGYDLYLLYIFKYYFCFLEINK